MKNSLEKPLRQFLNLPSLIQYCRDHYDLPISRISIYRATKEGKLPHIKANARLLFKITDVDRWILGGEAKFSDNAIKNQEVKL